MQERTSQILYAYWNEVRRDRVAPRRLDVEPMRIAEILPDTLILERADNTSFRFRLAGTRLCEQFGLELRGVDFLGLWRESDKGQIARLFANVSDHGAAALVRFDALTEKGAAAAFELLLLPLVHTRDIIDRYLGAISATGPTPQWPGYERVASLRIVHSELIWPNGKPSHFSRADSPSQIPLRAEAARGRIVRADRRQFRVFEGGRSK